LEYGSPVLFPTSTAHYSGAGDERVEVESGFAGSCTGVHAAFDSVALMVAMSAVHFVKGTPAVAGDAVGWRVDRARSSRGVSRRRASIHGRRSSGCVPGRCSLIDVFIPGSTSGVFCGFLKASMRWAPPDLGWLWSLLRWQRPAMDRRRRSMESSGDFGKHRFFVVIFVFLRGLCVRWVGLYPPSTYLHLYASLYVFLIQ
jgi:hypothetical protein